MQVVPFRRAVPAMSRTKKGKAVQPKEPPPTTCMDDAFAVTSTGLVLVNAMWFDGVETAEDALRRARREPSRIFVGVALDADEMNYVIDYMRDLVEEPMGLIIGGRQRRERPPLMPSSRGRRS